MEIDWSALDSALGVALIVIVIWVGLKLMKHLLVAVIVIALLAVVFSGAGLVHLPFLN